MADTTDSLIIHMFACLSDNYGFLVHDSDSGKTACIDTPDADAIIRELEIHHWKLDYILNTHHHWDHAGGNLQLKEKYNCTVIGAANDARRIPGIDIQVGEGDSFRLGEHEFLVKETPGHTSGCLTYVLDTEEMAFTGDCLLIRGCGRTDFQGGDAETDSEQREPGDHGNEPFLAAGPEIAHRHHHFECGKHRPPTPPQGRARRRS